MCSLFILPPKNGLDNAPKVSAYNLSDHLTASASVSTFPDHSSDFDEYDVNITDRQKWPNYDSPSCDKLEISFK